MSSATSTFEGTAGTWPTVMSGDYPLFGWDSTPNHDTSDADLSTSVVFAGSTSCRVLDGATGAFNWSTAPEATTYFRTYFYLTATPSNHVSLLALYGSSYAWLNCAGITSSRQLYGAVRQSGSLGPLGGANAADRYKGTANEIPVGEWCRFEAKVTATTIEARVWISAGGDVTSVRTHDLTTGALTGSSVGTFVGCSFGAVANAAIMGTDTYLYLDNFSVGTSDWRGPSDTTTHTATAASTATFTGASAIARTTAATAAGSSTFTGASALGLSLSATAASTATLTAAADAVVTKYMDAASTATFNGATQLGYTTHEATATGAATLTGASALDRTAVASAAGAATFSGTTTFALSGLIWAAGSITAAGASNAVIGLPTSPGFLRTDITAPARLIGA